MIIYDIPKEFRSSFKLELDKNYCFISSNLFYISIRDKATHEEKDFFVFLGSIKVNLLDMIEKNPSCDFVCIYDNRYSINVNYSMYDENKYKNYSYFEKV